MGDATSNASNSEVFNNEAVESLQFSQGIRRQIVRSLMPQGQVPKDPDNLNMLLKTLDSSDRTVLTQAKIQAESNNANRQIDVQARFADLLNNMPTSGGAAGSREGLTLPGEFSAIELVEGETKVGTTQLNLDDFVTTVETTNIFNR